MKRWLWLVTMSLALLVGQAEAAKRFGSGKSIGQQSSNVTQRQTAPAQGATNTPTNTPAAAPAAAAAPKKPWGAMLGGLAAGLGLAWLASSLGLGAAMGQFMMFALLALVIMMLVGWFMRSRQNKGVAQPASPFAFQGAGAGQAAAPASYRPENVGNDASARPWERTTTAFDNAGMTSATAATGSMIGSGLAGSQSWGIPAGFDTDGFLKSAKANFVSLQAAWDKSDIGALRAMMTDTMLKEIQAQLADREAHTGGPVNLTEVVMIEAHLLGIEDLGDAYMASVEFSGMIREEPSAGPNPFREVWNMTKSKNGPSGWLVAGVQALQ
jgi:predicted lipid-binding transport protein (Tim44 family)